jgi:BNR repeat-like domain/BNR/Asp-box repeat
MVPTTRASASVVVRRSTVAAVVALLASAAVALAATLGTLSTASRQPSPFAGCTDGQSSGPPPGEVFVNAEVEPWVDVNPTNGSNVIGVWQQDRWTDGGSHSNDTGYSTDGGATWHYPATPIPWSTCAGSTESRYQRATDPWVSFGPDGTAHAIALSLDPNGFTTAILASRSTDGGANWSAPAVLIDDNDLRFFNDKESITADPTDADLVYAVWDRIFKPGQSKGFPSQLNSFAFRGVPYIARSTDGGATWEAARRITDKNSNFFTIGNQVAVLPDGTLLDFTDYGTGSGVQPSVHDWKAVYRSTDHGATWTPTPVTISQNLEVRHTIPDGSFPIRVGGDDVAVDPGSGDVYAVWTDGRFNDGSHNDVVLSKSTDGGLTWSDPVKVSKNPVGVDAFTPSVHVNAAGDVAVSYYDFRNQTAATGVETDFWFELSTNGGSTWTESRLTDSSFDITTAPVAPASRGYFLGDYEGMSSHGSTFSNLFVVTTGSTSNRTDVMFRTVTP